MQTILILDDDAGRLEGFRQIVHRFGEGFDLRTWSSAPRMLAGVERWLSSARLISLDHDLYRAADEDADPGTGRQVAEHLAERPAVCPVIVHSTNTDQAWGMFNVLSRAGWRVEIVHHVNDAAWIEERWLPAALHLVGDRPALRDAIAGTAAPGARPVFIQSGVIPYLHTGDGVEVLLVRRTNATRWTIPKGGVDPGLTPAESACREAWEEAGVSGVIAPEPLGQYSYEKLDGVCVVDVFAMSVVVHHEHWPERPERERRWFPPAEAQALVRQPALATTIDVLLRRVGAALSA